MSTQAQSGSGWQDFIKLNFLRFRLYANKWLMQIGLLEIKLFDHLIVGKQMTGN